MAFDRARHVTVLYGGDTGGDETWTWDGHAWTMHDAPGPGFRSLHAMAYDAARVAALRAQGVVA